jgi:uncharacterized protein YxeA
MEGDKLELYKMICLIVAFVVILSITIFVIKDLFIDMRNRNISQKNRQKEEDKKNQSKAVQKSKLKVYKGSNKKKANDHRIKPKLIKVK